MNRKYGPSLRGGALVATLGLLIGGSVAVAQDANSTPDATLNVTGEVAHPAHIHSGTCADLGDVVYPLSDVGIPASTDSARGSTPMAAATNESSGSAEAIPAYVGITQLNVSIEDLLAEPHAINVHESADNIDNYIACGDIGGVTYGDTLEFGLRSLNDSGNTGIALISADSDGSVNVVVYLAPTGQ